MGRPRRHQPAGHIFHIINRGNGGAVVFHKDTDYQAFLDLLEAGKSKFSVRVLAFCVMPNHFHIVVQPETEATLSPFMKWWQTTHARRYHRHYGSHGHLWQGRFKNFPIERDEHLLIVLRYVLRNPVRAKLVRRTAEWRWSSLQHPSLVDHWPVPVPADWSRWIEQPLFAHELAQVRTCVNRQSPFGFPSWQEQCASDLGLESTLRPPGRPCKAALNDA